MQSARSLHRSRFEKYSFERRLPQDAKPAPERYVPGRLRKIRMERLNKALHKAAMNCDLQAMRSCIERGAQVNSVINGMTPLLRALSHGAYDLEDAVEYLLKKGANPNIVNESGWSPLIAASFAGNMWHVRLLLEHGADPKHADSYGETALDVAAKKGNYEVAQLLIKYSGRSPPGTDGYAREKEVEGMMLNRLLRAVGDGDIKQIERLLELGVNISLKNQYRMFPVMYAIFGGNQEVLEFLKNNGADPDMEGQAGRDAMEYARELMCNIMHKK